MTRAFPAEGLLAKKETQATLLHAKGILGQGTRVAILDTGVDPAAAGLTSRVVDCIDCTGDGDVPLKSVEPVHPQRQDDSRILLPSITGRLLSVNPEWKNPTGKWKVGYKRAWDFWPKDLVSRRKAERKEDFDLAMGQLLASTVSELDAFEQNTKAPEDKASEDDKAAYELKKKDLQDRIKAVESAKSSFEDPGPFIEAAVWHDGEHWRAVCAAAEGRQGEELGVPFKTAPGGDSQVVDLTAKRPMTDFHVERHFDTFGDQDLLTYSANFYQDGDLLSLVTVSGAHGTHVAGIVAANHPDNADLNGLAPETEIVSLKIGDARLDSLETHKALLRAASAILDTGCDLANMSFGEDSAWGMEERGAFVEALVKDVCRKRDVIFVTSAGNSGPALSTVGAPAAAAGPLVVIGAWVSQSMQQAEYALLDQVNPSVYTWCSRGPLFNGARGLTCYAPGAAITSVPLYTLKHTQLMNGTSMSSPHACGGLALLVSSLKEQKMKHSPSRVKSAITATYKDINEDVGLLQLENALHYLREHQAASEEDVDWVINVTPRGGETGRGVYLRTPEECSAVQELAVEAVPQLKRQETKERYAMDVEASLVSDAKWVECPSFAVFNGSGRLFKIRINPESLEPGLHRATITARTNDRQLFTIPVTVAKPQTVTQPTVTFTNRFQPGTIKRHFLYPPAGTTWADIRVTTSNRETAAQIWLHCVQVAPMQRLSQTENAFIWSLMPGEPTTQRRIKVTGGVPLEVCATQAWQASGRTDIEIVCDFHGLSLASGPERLSLVSGKGLAPFDVFSALRTESFNPSISFDSRRSIHRPAKATVTGMTSRDRLPGGSDLLRLELSYDFKLSSKSSVAPQFPITNHLYDGPFAVLSCIYSGSKEVCAWGDMYKRDVSLSKGSYTLKMEVLHPSKSVLESLKAMPMTLDIKLEGAAKDTKLSIYRDHVDALAKGPELKTEGTKVPKDSRRAFKVKTALSSEALTAVLKDGKAGDLLLGSYHLSPASYKLGRPVELLVPPAEPKFEEGNEDSKEPTPMVDLQIELGKKLTGSERVKYLKNLAEENPNHLASLVAHLEALEDEASDNDVEAACDAIFNLIDEDELARQCGTRAPERLSAEEKKREKQNSAEKSALCLAFERKSARLVKRNADNASHTSSDDSYVQASESEDKDEGASSAAEQSSPAAYSDMTSLLKQWRRWAPSETDPKLSLATARDHLSHGRYGSALVLLQKVLEDLGKTPDKAASEARSLMQETLSKLGWSLLHDINLKLALVREPPQGYALW